MPLLKNGTIMLLCYVVLYYYYFKYLVDLLGETRSMKQPYKQLQIFFHITSLSVCINAYFLVFNRTEKSSVTQNTHTHTHKPYAKIKKNLLEFFCANFSISLSIYLSLYLSIYLSVLRYFCCWTASLMLL